VGVGGEFELTGNKVKTVDLGIFKQIVSSSQACKYIEDKVAGISEGFAEERMFEEEMIHNCCVRESYSKIKPHSP